MKRISIISRVLIVLGSLALIATYFYPIWRIELFAPQYPEGLYMTIWLDNVGGQVELINGLNHYIGMKLIKKEMFPEFVIMPYLVAGVIALGVMVGLLGKRKLLLGFCIFLVILGIAALVDFYIWEYNYGHNLDPHAALKIPGESYQPPLIGYKRMLNFGAYSIPDVGGWIIFGYGVLCVLLYTIESFMARKKRRSYAYSMGLLLMASISLQGCSVEPQPLNYGEDACDHCRMMLMDQKYGAEILTTKGKAYKFDDLNCMVFFQTDKDLTAEEIHGYYAVDYAGMGELHNLENMQLLYSKELKTPMNSYVVAFNDVAGFNEAQEFYNGQKITFQQLQEMYRE